MKKNLNKYFRLMLIGGLIFSMQSCLKNNKFYTDFSKGKPAVELPLAASKANKPIAVSFDVSNTPSQYYAVVNVASVNKPTTTVTATLGIDQAYLDQYNDDNSTTFELMPDSAYQIATWDATIQPGHREDSIPIMIFTNKIAPGHNYILPLTIVSSSIEISSWNHLMLNIGAKNKFDGKYTVDGTFVDLTAPAFSGDYPKTVSLVTQGLSTDAYFDGDLGGFGYVFYTGTGYSYFGNWAPVFTFDADGNVTAVSNYFTDPAPRMRNSQLDTDTPGAINKYDIDSKSMDVNYYFMQAGGIRGKIHEVWTYKGPR